MMLINRGMGALSEIPLDRPPGAIHVVHGVLSLDLGGLERLVLALIETGQRSNYRTSVVCIDEPGQLADTARALGAEVHCLQAAGDRGSATRRATELFARIRPDVLHTHQIGALWHLGRAVSHADPVAIVHTEHSDHAALARGLHSQLKSRFWWHRAGRLPHRFCCVSADIATSVRRWHTVPDAKVAVVPNGVDTVLFARREQRDALRQSLGFSANDHVIGTVGRLNEVKRQDLLVRAFARLLPAHPQARLLIVGDGPEREPLQQLATSLGIATRTTFAGYQSQTEHYLSAMDSFALSSRHEGLPLALLEAWAAGLPVVASAVGGIPQIVEHQRTGLLFENGDEAGLANGISRILDEPAFAAALASAGRAKVVADYSLERMAQLYDHHYHAALAQG